MKDQISRHIWLFLGLVVALTMVACTPAAKKVEGPEPDIISRPGFYKDKIVGFSFTWQKDIFSVPGDPENGERVRVSHTATVPVLSISVTPKTAESPALADLGEDFMKKLQEKQMGSQQFKLRENQIIQLANGSDAAYALITWKYGGNQALVTAVVMAYKGDNLITVNCSASPGQPPVEVLKKWVMPLQLF